MGAGILVKVCDEAHPEQSPVDHGSVSRRHARISIGPGGATLEDLGSRNGTFLGGRRLDSIAELADGDVIGLGPVTLVFEKLAAPGTTESDLSR